MILSACVVQTEKQNITIYYFLISSSRIFCYDLDFSTHFTPMKAPFILYIIFIFVSPFAVKTFVWPIPNCDGPS